MYVHVVIIRQSTEYCTAHADVVMVGLAWLGTRFQMIGIIRETQANLLGKPPTLLSWSGLSGHGGQFRWRVNPHFAPSNGVVFLYMFGREEGYQRDSELDPPFFVGSADVRT